MVLLMPFIQELLTNTHIFQEMIKRTYRDGFMPNRIIFDNNCSVAKHVKGDLDFANVGLAVDVFSITAASTL